MAPSFKSLLSYAGQLVTQIPLGQHNSNNGHGAAAVAPADTPMTSPFNNGNNNNNNNNNNMYNPAFPLTGAPSCPINGPTSCHNQTETDSCCFIHPGGRLLLTQFWDSKVHVGGGEEDWTVHGLWPDLCDGSYDQFCGMTPQYNDITKTLKEHGQGELVEWMNRYWLANYGSNDHLWAHEYNKHATCINTLAPNCYGPDYTPGAEVVDYFTAASSLFRNLDTYRALERVGITPSYGTQYKLEDIQTALDEFSGGKVILKCGGRHRNVLHEAWYVYFVKGSLQAGEFVPASDSFKGDQGNCNSLVRYLPKRK